MSNVRSFVRDSHFWRALLFASVLSPGIVFVGHGGLLPCPALLAYAIQGLRANAASFVVTLIATHCFLSLRSRGSGPYVTRLRLDSGLSSVLRSHSAGVGTCNLARDRHAPLHSQHARRLLVVLPVPAASWCALHVRQRMVFTWLRSSPRWPWGAVSTRRSDRGKT